MDALKTYRQQIEGVMVKKCPKNKKYPKPWDCVGQRETEYAYQYAYECPSGESLLTLEKQIDAFYAACGAIVELKDRAGKVEIHVLRNDFDDVHPYNPEYLKLCEGREVLIGFTRQGEAIFHNFKTPHMTIAGASGYGKTDAIRFMLLQLISRFTPDELEIDIIDLKRFSFLPFREIPHVRKVVGTIEDAVEVLEDAYNVMIERADAVVETGNRSLISTFKWRIVLIDEAAMLAPKLATDGKDKKIANLAASYMSKISCVGREASVGLVFSTQYPTAEVIHGQIRANMEAVMCFKTENDVHSNVAIGSSGAEKLGKPGRAFYKSSTGRTIVQVPFVGDDDAWKEVLAPYATGRPAETNCTMAPFQDTSDDDTSIGDDPIQLELFPIEKGKHNFD